MRLDLKSLAESLGRVLPGNEKRLRAELEEQRRKLLEEAEAFDELVQTKGWRLFSRRAEALNQAATDAVMLNPPVASEVLNDMTPSTPKLVIVVRPTADRRRLSQMLSWLRWLVPAALLLVAPTRIPELPDSDVIQLDCADGFDGPLSVARMLARHLPG